MSWRWVGELMPTIYLSNWASRRTPGHHGPGAALTIMARPRSWEHGHGRVDALTPAVDNLDAVRAGTISTAEYRERFVAGLTPARLRPGRLTSAIGCVVDGDTLCCACSRDAAAAGECHRVWAAGALKEAGWDVVLDGSPL